MPDLSRGCADSLAYWVPPLPEPYPAEDDDRWSSEDASDEEKEANRERNTPSTGNSQANAVFELRRSLNRYLRSPLPTPSFDQYVGAGLLLTGSFEDATYNELLNNNEYGREWGNLCEPFAERRRGEGRERGAAAGRKRGATEGEFVGGEGNPPEPLHPRGRQ
jgi:hypothetical protein